MKKTLQFKLEALCQITAGQGAAEVLAVLGMASTTLKNWQEAEREGKLLEPGSWYLGDCERSWRERRWSSISEKIHCVLRA